MTTKTGADPKIIILFGVCFLIIASLLALYTPNPDMGNGNDTSYVKECKPYFLNGVQCPLDKNQSVSNLSDNQTVTSSG